MHDHGEPGNIKDKKKLDALEVIYERSSHKDTTEQQQQQPF